MATSVEPLCAHLLKLNGDPSPSLTFEPFDLPSSNQRVLGAPHPTDTVTRWHYVLLSLDVVTIPMRLTSTQQSRL